MTSLSGMDRELLAWLGSRGSGSALRSELTAVFGDRVDDVGGWLRSLEQRGLLATLDPFGTEERCVLTEAGLRLLRRSGRR